VNEAKPQWVVQKVKAAMLEVLAAKDPETVLSSVTVACLGLTFKPDVDDVRESPAVEVVTQVACVGVRIVVVEPNLKTLPPGLAMGKDVFMMKTVDAAVATADVVCVLVAHKEFVAARTMIAAHAKVVDVVGLCARSSMDGNEP
jgi:UDP-N-acetyl-D-mannosaminuronic acid dehydrogenase